MLCSEVVEEARCVYWCVLAMFLAGQGFLDWRLHRVQVSPVLCFHFLHSSWEAFFTLWENGLCGHLEQVVRAKPGILGHSDRPDAGWWGAFGVLSPQTQRDRASTFAQGLGGALGAASMGLRECSNFTGKKSHKTAFVWVAERNQVLHLWMQCGAASSLSYTLWLDRSQNSFNL